MRNSIPEIQLKYIPNSKKRGINITGSQSAFMAFLNTWNMDTISLYEEFKILLLNRSNQVLGVHTLAKGGTSAAMVDLKLLFAVVLKTASSSIILAHNHPSGNLKPSIADLKLQTKVQQAALFLDVELLDNIIITKEGFYSYINE
mgnify:CR=1 FL=1